MSAAGASSALKGLSKAVKSLGAAGMKLIEAHHNAALARGKATHHHRGAGAELHDEEVSASKTRKAKRTENPKAAFTFYSPLFFVLTEIALLVIEMGFFYQVMSRDIDPRAALFDPLRVSAALFAVFTPMAGVLAERLTGNTTGRRLRAPADNTAGERGTQTVAMIAGLVALTVASVAVFAVVGWRYDTTTSLTLSAGLPGWAMATLFVVVLWTLAALRAFTTDVSPLQVRPKALRDLRRSSVRADSDVIIADLVWAQAAWGLSIVITQVATALERILFTTEDVIATSRAAQGNPLAAVGTSSLEIPAPDHLSALAMPPTTPVLRSVHSDETTNLEPIPSDTAAMFPVPHIPERLWHVDLPLLNPYLVALRHAVQILTEYRPPITTPAARAKEVTTHLDTTAPEAGDAA